MSCNRIKVEINVVKHSITFDVNSITNTHFLSSMLLMLVNQTHLVKALFACNGYISNSSILLQPASKFFQHWQWTKSALKLSDPKKQEQYWISIHLLVLIRQANSTSNKNQLAGKSFIVQAADNILEAFSSLGCEESLPDLKALIY